MKSGFDYKNAIEFPCHEGVKPDHIVHLLNHSVFPIFYVAMYGTLEILKLFVDAGCDINAKGFFGNDDKI